MKFIARLAAFIAGLFIMGLGICLVSISGLGNSPISSPSWVLSQCTSLSFGTWTLLFTVVFFAGELLLYGWKRRPDIWLQLPVAPVLGLIIDLFMNLIPNGGNASLLQSLLLLAGGCFTLAGGIWMQVKASVVINPGEGIVKAFACRLGKQFGTVKLIFDSSLVALAFILSIIFLGRVEGLGVGTIVSAVTVGPLVRLCDRLWSRSRLTIVP